jgi:acyl-CoA thioesterase
MTTFDDRRRRGGQSGAPPAEGEGSAPSLAEAVAAGMSERDQVSRRLGIVIEQAARQRVRLRMQVSAEMLNAHGLCHGGVLFTLADSAFAFACNSENLSTLALAAQITFLSPARLGEVLIADAKATAGQGRYGVYDVIVTAADGRTVAVFRGTAARVKGETLPGLRAIEDG